MFTRKHYKEIAEIISKIEDHKEYFRMVGQFSQYFKKDNPNFDAYKFQVACDVKHFPHLRTA